MNDGETPWYEDFYGQDYLQALGPSLTNTDLEAVFAVNALEMKPGDRVLDLCCGQGRHAVLLAARGIAVTGQDQSANYLADARAAAQNLGIELPLVQSDMREIPFESHFDHVINMFTSFGYFDTEDDDRQVLNEIRRALKPGGRLLIDLLNREWVIEHNEPSDRRVNDDGTIVLEQRKLNLETNRNEVTFTFIDSNGNQRESSGHRIRLYTLPEITRMLRDAGLVFDRAYGGFNSEHYSPSTRRMIVVAHRPN
ncbi:MAG: class I SAM-dependent methyltransferase [Chloroflexi bacterium]|nr:class I SAM-dependent methyltransferase [Chloroflexota bacterium]